MSRLNLLLDSGAYTCWTKQEELSVREYGEFALPLADKLAGVVNLDVIPGEYGRVPSAAEVEASAAKGWENFLELRSMGIESIPVFHMGEDFKWLCKMVDDGCGYIGISPANDRTPKQKQEWLDEVFGLLCGSRGYPEVKTHGFGATNVNHIVRYPWYSVDSVTWLLVGGYGAIMVPKADPIRGGFDLTTSPKIVQFSERAGTRAVQNTNAVHYKQLGDAARGYVDEWLEKFGVTPDVLRDEYLIRQKLNALFFAEVVEANDPAPFRKPGVGFFHQADAGYGTKKNLFGKVRKVFAMTSSWQHSDVLCQCEQWNRLLTYYYFRRKAPFDLAEYIETGQIPHD